MYKIIEVEPLYILAFSNIHKILLDVDSLPLLLTDRVAQTEDDEEMIPIDLFLKRAKGIPFLSHNKSRDGIHLYKRFIQASFSYFRGPRDVHLKRTVWRVGNLPHWLLHISLSEESIQQMLLDLNIQKSFVFVVLFY
jgi:hypothetical protein